MGSAALLGAGAVAAIAGGPSVPPIGLITAGGLGVLAAGYRSAFRSTPTLERSSPPDLHDALGRELERGRRFGRSFALVRLEVPSSRDRYALWQRLSTEVRRIDTVCMYGGAVFAVLPEANRLAASAMIGRVLLSDSDVVSSWSLVVYPDDGMTAGALLDALRHAGEPNAAPQARRGHIRAIRANRSS